MSTHKARVAAILSATGICFTLADRFGWAPGLPIALAAFLFMVISLTGCFSRLAGVVILTSIPMATIALIEHRIVLSDLSAAIFVFAFILAGGLLRQIALRDQRLLQLGAYLVALKTGVRYSVVSLVVALQSVTLLIGALQFFAGMVETRTPSDSPHRIATLLSGLIGFTLNPILSPVAIPFIVISSFVPELVWTDMLPAAAGVALALWVVGFLQDRRLVFASVAQSANHEAGHFDPLAIAIVLTPVAMAVATMMTSQLNLAESALLAIVIFTLFQLSLTDASTELLKTGLIQSRNEAAVIAGSIATGLAILSLLPEGMLSGLGTIISDFAMFAPIGIIVVFVLFGQIGLQPSVSFLILLPFVSELLSVDTIAREPVLVSVVTGWALNSVTSPFGVPVLIVGGAAGVEATSIAWRHNLAFAIGGPLASGLFLGLLM